MKFNFDNVEFDNYDYDCLSDIIFDALEKENLSKEEIFDYWKMLPDDIKADAIKWGISDTPTRESIFEWLEKNK